MKNCIVKIKLNRPYTGITFPVMYLTFVKDENKWGISSIDDSYVFCSEVLAQSTLDDITRMSSDDFIITGEVVDFEGGA